MREGVDRKVWSLRAARKHERLLEMSLAVLEPRRPNLRAPQVQQADRAELLVDYVRSGARRFGGSQQSPGLLHDPRDVAPPLGDDQLHAGDPSLDLHAPFLGHEVRYALGQLELPLSLLERSLPQLVGRAQRADL